MKILKRIGLVILGLVGIVLILGIFAPKHLTVERKAFIHASSADVVNNYLAPFKVWPQWSAWHAKDTATTYVYEGTDGVVGSKSTHNGKESGKGQMTLQAKSNNSVKIQMHFMEPMDGMADILISTKDSADGCIATWKFDMDAKYPFNALYLFMDMNSMIGQDFEDGLKNIDKLITSTLNVEIVDLKPQHYLLVKGEVEKNNMAPFFQKNFGFLYGEISKTGKSVGVPTEIVYEWNDAKSTCITSAAIPTDLPSLKGAEAYDLKAGKALRLVYTGPYERVGIAHHAIEKKMKAEGWKMNGNPMEEYINDPEVVKDPMKYQTAIIYPVMK